MDDQDLVVKMLVMQLDSDPLCVTSLLLCNSTRLGVDVLYLVVIEINWYHDSLVVHRITQ